MTRHPEPSATGCLADLTCDQTDQSAPIASVLVSDVSHGDDHELGRAHRSQMSTPSDTSTATLTPAPRSVIRVLQW